MASYFQSSPNLFDRRFADLRRKDPDAQTLYMYQDRCRHRNSEGLFWLPRSYITTDIGMDPREVDNALRVLEEAQYINYDFDNEIILDRLALKFFRPSGEKQIKGAVRVFTQVPKSPLKAEFLNLAFKYAEGFADHIVEACPELGHPGHPSLDSDPTEGVSELGDTLSPNQAGKGYPEPEIPREELSAKQLRDELGVELPDPLQTGPLPEEVRDDPVGLAVKALNAEVVWQDGGPR